MQVFIKLINGEIIKQKIRSNTCVIGRSVKCDVVIPHEGMSRQHCQVDLNNGDLFITDMGSTNGVFIDGKRIETNKKTPYQTFLTLSFGAVQSMQIELDEIGARAETKIEFPSSPQVGHTSTIMLNTGKKKLTPDTARSTLSNVERLKISAKKEKQKTQIKYAVIVLTLAIVVWWYMQSEAENNTEFGPSDPTLQVQ